MKKFLFLIMALALPAALFAQVNIPRQEVYYNVNYHWGIIDVMIAHGVVTVETDGNNFRGTLDGTSIPWDGHIICVSDTLQATMTPNASGLSAEYVDYQSGWYRRPHVNQFRSSTYNPDDPAIYKNTRGQGTYDASNDSMEAIAVTTDMIAMFYYAKEFDFASMQPGWTATMPIGGNYEKQVQITYEGTGTYSTNGVTYPTYDISFQYSYNGQMSGYNVKSKIGATERVPLFFSASLPVGEVEMLWEPAP